VRIFADTNVTGAAVAALRSAGHDVVWSGERAADPGDATLLREAAEDERAFLTKDRDIGTVVYRDGASHAGVLLIDELCDPAAEAVWVVELIANCVVQLQARAFLRAGPGGIREGQPSA
jgi:predicted nuclease of predicted toxin-antitoxin system